MIDMLVGLGIAALMVILAPFYVGWLEKRFGDAIDDGVKSAFDDIRKRDGL